MTKKKLLVILGPTASGKSDLAIEMAKKFNGEIISADSRQVYKGMDLGTGKVERDKNFKEFYSEGVRHYLLDIVEPQQYFSVYQYQKLALKAINEILKKKKLPILCGGTGLYISAVIENWKFLKIKPNFELRKKLEKLSLEELFEKLKKIDPQRATTIDPKNKRRIIRALEIALTKGKVPPLEKKPLKMNILILGIQKEKEELKKLIKTRLEKRINLGMIEEVKNLKEKGVSSERLEEFGLEYRWVNRYLEGKITLEEMKKRLYNEIVKYAKRQMTWFKKMKNIYWIKTKEEAFSLVENWLKN
ncbi:MAG: tRNA (adenosine(37)-N6)-dimethylallyltransferase MiaA [Candidatus Paceibacterota bacterium]